MRFLTIGAHPDDEILGCGATTCRLIEEGAEGYVVIVTEGSSTQYDGDKEIGEEKIEIFKEVIKEAGYKKFYLLGYPDMKLDQISHVELNNKLSGIIKEIKPDIIFTPWRNDLNLDHKIITASVEVCIRPPFKGKVLMYEIPSSTELSSEGFQPNIFFSIKEEHLNKKIRLFLRYYMEVRKFPHARSPEYIKALATIRGSQAGTPFAEGFILVKEII